MADNGRHRKKKLSGGFLLELFRPKYNEPSQLKYNRTQISTASNTAKFVTKESNLLKKNGPSETQERNAQPQTPVTKITTKALLSLIVFSLFVYYKFI